MESKMQHLKANLSMLKFLIKYEIHRSKKTNKKTTNFLKKDKLTLKIITWFCCLCLFCLNHVLENKMPLLIA